MARRRGLRLRLGLEAEVRRRQQRRRLLAVGATRF